jgi:hypothetical protein
MAIILGSLFWNMLRTESTVSGNVLFWMLVLEAKIEGYNKRDDN